ncbi:MAG: adenine deaminase, partial [Planctomycetes bacterium]|nr:adenine deaminase [Planctomycetota bacterium]
KNKIIDGHAPGLSGHALAAYRIAGITSDHECTTRAEAREKLQAGMHIMIREGTAAKNLKDLLKAVTPFNSHRCSLVTDDRHPGDLLHEGHINFVVQKAIRLGLNPIRAIQMATINTANYFGLKQLGAIVPGYQADLLVIDNLKNLRVRQVFKKGSLIANNGKLIKHTERIKKSLGQNTIKISRLTPDKFRIKDQGGKIKIIGIISNQIVTKKIIAHPKVTDGIVVTDLKKDILKIAVLERHHRSGRIGLGFVKGIGLKKGAIASSVAHDSHNIIVVGTNDLDMCRAAQALAPLGGGQIIVVNGKVVAALPLPIAGIMSDQPIDKVAREIKLLNRAAHSLGCRLPDPFMTLSFMALAPIPELKLTDRGLIDVSQFKIVSLFS